MGGEAPVLRQALEKEEGILLRRGLGSRPHSGDSPPRGEGGLTQDHLCERVNPGPARHLTHSAGHKGNGEIHSKVKLKQKRTQDQEGFDKLWKFDFLLLTCIAHNRYGK